jgi:acyl carrier protein
MNNARASIRAFIFDKFPLAKSRGVGDGENLLQGGFVDSLGILDVVSYLERQFGIVVDDEELIPEHFESIDALTAFANRKASEAARQEVS